MNHRFKKPLFKISVIVIVTFVLLEALIFIIPFPEEKLKRSQSTLVYSKEGKVLRAFISKDGKWRIWTPLEDISPHLIKFVVNYEDRFFYYHPGVNPLAIMRAFWQNIRTREIVSGGSTITMQVSRLMEPKKRTLKNKIIEAFRALQLEHFYTKNEILEMYLNLAPYGGNIEGVEAASYLYFGKAPSQLSYAEAALITSLPQSPTILRPDYNPDGARKARNKVLKRMLRSGVIDKDSYLEAMEEPVPASRREWPFIAPHLCRELHLENNDRSRIYATIDSDIQLMTKRMLVNHLRAFKSKGITNGSVVVIDNKTHEIKAMVGSVSFFDEDNNGQVNGALALRSPGSTLKPFIYGLGICQGIITPGHYLEDVPIDYGGYSPENYDRTYNGIVSAEEALKRSLNVPAVNLNARLNEGTDLYRLLKKAGISSIRNLDNYGLAIALGGCEINLLELTSLYSSMACGGYYYEPILTENKKTTSVKLFDEGTSFIITEILTELRRPDLPAAWQFTDLPRIAWKTGTSYGHRDAWSIGYNPRYTVGVWLGNFDGRGSPNLVGARAAAPLLFDIFNVLNKNNPTGWFERPDTVGIRKVCSLSGQLPNKYCPATVEEYYLKDRSPTVKCQFHRIVYLNEEGYRVPKSIKKDFNLERKIYIHWPPRIASWRTSHGYPVYQLPELQPDFQHQLSGKPPVIESPVEGVIYDLRQGVSDKYQKIAFTASVSNDVSHIYWFVDGSLIGTVKPGEKLFYLPEPGEHEVVCQDDMGRLNKINIIIKK
ncbi:penicillin-binding protein 1C [Halothermothrix orenii H 168]|uniref:Penicillin-binding protein 1A n=2 Tax=Halothermothrix orenii TaxID=31909 RepID=B8CWQ4_HALOH|nr:penicillin-binding protein 1C [Halothermothrix orenii H 168]